MLTVHHSAEARFVETLGDIHELRDSWTAIAFHLESLLEEYRSAYQLKIAVNLLSDLLRHYEGAIYVFGDGGIMVLCNHLSPPLLNKLIFQMRYLYMDDPLAYSADGYENPAFCTAFRLGEDWQRCHEFATRSMMRNARAKTPGAPQIVAPKKTPVADNTNGRLDASSLVNIERNLNTIDVSAALRRQPVCAVMPSGKIRTVFEEIYVNIAHLRRLVGVEVDFQSNKWLFRHLTQMLDTQVISTLKHQKREFFAQPVSINVNTDTLLSGWFKEFDASLKPESKASILFEIQAMDVLADIGAFQRAREMVQKQGYRICIDGLTPHSFLHIDRERLKADLVKLVWMPELAQEKEPPASVLARAIRHCGTNRVVLCRCDTKEAVEWGKELGISLFQGRYLDSLVDPQGTVEN